MSANRRIQTAHGPRTTDHGPPKWHFSIDRGGTFTDVLARHADEGLIALKLLSERPGEYQDAALEGIRRILFAHGAALDDGVIGSVRMGSTVATNALLEGTGEPTLLVITRGFGDALEIGYQDRPDIFALRIDRPLPPYVQVIEADERIGPDGNVLQALDEASLMRELRAARATGLNAAAIVFMHGFRFPQHELRAAAMARDAGFEFVCTSHETAGLIKLVTRGETTVADAHLTPVVERFVRSLETTLRGSNLFFMQSSGGLTGAGSFRGKDAVLSGPAGGAIGMADVGRASGFTKMIGFDMGGTSTDVSLYDGQFERLETLEVAGVRLRTAALDVHTVAAGGGSVLEFDGARLRVGDRSAGAYPGPVCYGRGGPPTVTDCHVQLGRIRPSLFPQVFGASGDQAIDAQAVSDTFASMAARVQREAGVHKSPDELASDFLRIAVQKTAQAVRRISIERGHDPEEFVLIPFGGAAGQIACLLADQLSIKKILVDPLAGLLSAQGIEAASVSKIGRRTVGRVMSSDVLHDVARISSVMGDDLLAEVSRTRAEGNTITETRLYLKFRGVDATTPVVLSTAETMRKELRTAHQKRFGFEPPSDEVVVEFVEVEATVTPGDRTVAARVRTIKAGRPLEVADVWMDGRRAATPFYRRDDLAVKQTVVGPAVIVDQHSTTVVEPGWTAEMRDTGALMITRDAFPERSPSVGVEYDPTRLEIFNNLFRHVAEEMGIQLRQTSRSVNIKERLDFSCALFDGSGGLVANAPHMPVHIGSMSETVREIIRRRSGRMQPGDAYLTNDPYHGGTHVPDLTVVNPFFAGDEPDPVFFVASRAHHAEIGGMLPGSMPALSRSIDEEGVLFEDFPLVTSGRFNEGRLFEILRSGPWPSRNPETNAADLRAQLAANQTGLMRLRELADQHGLPTVRAYMGHVKRNAADAVRRALQNVSSGEATVTLDNGQQIAVRIDVDPGTGTATVDFEGTSQQGENNLNAPKAVTTAAVLYVMRLLVDEDIPLNEGCLDPIELRIPAGSMLNPISPAAVAGGNVETSQCIVDALLAALQVMAGSQGTMNNLTFGDDDRQYYETICGGSGAGPCFDGTSGVHTHMTNSRLTDPEVLETSYPVVVEAFGLRKATGGAGRWQGGDGVVRKIRFEKEMAVSILSNHRIEPPKGLAGGQDGAVGRNRLIRADGRQEDLPSQAGFDVDSGDVVVIETPGGGGFGSVDQNLTGLKTRQVLRPDRSIDPSGL